MAIDAEAMLADVMLKHRERMQRLSELDVRTTAGLAALHAEVIHDDAQVSVARSERVKQLIGDIFNGIFAGDHPANRSGSGTGNGVDADAGGAEVDSP